MVMHEQTFNGYACMLFADYDKYGYPHACMLFADCDKYGSVFTVSILLRSLVIIKYTMKLWKIIKFTQNFMTNSKIYLKISKPINRPQISYIHMLCIFHFKRMFGLLKKKDKSQKYIQPPRMFIKMTFRVFLFPNISKKKSFFS